MVPPPFEQVQYTLFDSYEDFQNNLLCNEADLTGISGTQYLNNRTFDLEYWNFSAQDAGMIH